MEPAEWWSFTAASAVLWWMYGMKAEWSAGFKVRKTGTEWRWNGMHWPKAHWYNKYYMFCFRHNWWEVGNFCGFFLMGWTRRREKKHTTGKRKKRVVGILMEWNMWNGKSVPSAAGCWGGCMNWRWNEVEVRSEERTRVRNGNETWKGMHLPQAHW